MTTKHTGGLAMIGAALVALMPVAVHAQAEPTRNTTVQLGIVGSPVQGAPGQFSATALAIAVGAGGVVAGDVVASSGSVGAWVVAGPALPPGLTPANRFETSIITPDVVDPPPDP